MMDCKTRSNAMIIGIWRLMPDDTFVFMSGQGDVEAFTPVFHSMERYELDGMSYWTRMDGLTIGVQATGTYAFRLIQRVTTAFETQYPDWDTRDTPMPLNEIKTLLVDPLESIRSDLNETNTNMIDALDSLLRRGERLEAVEARSVRLRDSSRLFKQKVNSLWSCCYCPIM